MQTGALFSKAALIVKTRRILSAMITNTTSNQCAAALSLAASLATRANALRSSGTTPASARRPVRLATAVSIKVRFSSKILGDSSKDLTLET